MPSSWLNKMQNYEVNPPERAFADIANELDKEGKDVAEVLKLKMLRHEETPPVAVLDKIFSELDAEYTLPTPVYIDKLRNHLEPPPVEAWTNIIVKLNEDEGKIIPLNNGKKNAKTLYLKVAAAAAVIAIIIIAILPATKQHPAANGQVATIAPQNKPVQIPSANIIADTQKNDPAKTDVVNKQDKENSNHRPGSNNYAPGYVKGGDATDLAQNPAANNKEKLQNSKGETPMDIALLNPPNTYISITGADGQTVKVSSKFYNLIGYLTQGNPDTRENIDVIIAESDQWRKIFSAWRDKMTNNALAPSLSNFMDIIELSKIVEGKDK